jgi:hypothetical protein
MNDFKNISICRQAGKEFVNPPDNPLGMKMIRGVYSPSVRNVLCSFYLMEALRRYEAPAELK